LVALAVLITATLTVSATHIGDSSTNTLSDVYAQMALIAEFEAVSAAQQDAIAAYRVLAGSFCTENGTSMVYPANYGGAFLKDNILNIAIVDLQAQNITDYTELLNDHLDVVNFVDVSYSLNSLIIAARNVYDDMRSNGIAVTSCGVSPEDNSVMIGLSTGDTVASTTMGTVSVNLNQLAQAESNGYGVPVQTFEEAPLRPCATTTIMGGTMLYPGYTLGACGTYDGDPAFVTCGHSLNYTGEVVCAQNLSFQEDNRLGTVSFLRFNDQQAGDFAVITVDDNITTTNIVGNPRNTAMQFAIQSFDEGDDDPYGDVVSDLPGTAVMKFGAYGGLAWGTIDGMYFNGNILPDTGLDPLAQVEIRNLVRVEFTSGGIMRGDSGGPVFTSAGKFYGVISCAPLHVTQNNSDPNDDAGYTAFYFTSIRTISSATNGEFEVRMSA